ncbi:integrase [Escherichia coli]|uniref:Integrase n=1 Tax=Escherichia coli TaxID=562 RepID=A0A377C8Y0_ECOLX|nr:integrase [Escherichia coli]
MLWKNVDFENRIITIDASVMKDAKFMWSDVRPVVELLTTLSSITKPVSEFVFAGRNDKKSQSARTRCYL